jgi:hypothetical protein
MTVFDLEKKLQAVIEESKGSLDFGNGQSVSINGFITGSDCKLSLALLNRTKGKPRIIDRALTEEEIQQISELEDFDAVQQRVVLSLCESGNKEQTPTKLQTNGKTIREINAILKSKGLTYAIRSKDSWGKGDWWNIPKRFFPIQ